MNMNSKSIRIPRPLLKEALRWKNLAVLAAAFAIAVSLYRYMDTLHSGAIVAYLLYPASIGFVALLIYTRDFLRYSEVRLMGAFFVWTLLVIGLNMSRADGALSSGWFYSLCATSFLCFSLPYAFEDSEQARVVSALAWVTVLLTAALCAVAIFFAATGRVIEMRPGIEGAFGIGDDNRLGMFCHPNAAAPICGIGVVLSVYLFFTSSKQRLRFALLLPFLLGLVALTLTDSRAGILATALSIGVEAFALLCAKGFRMAKRPLRILLALTLSVILMVVFYQGTVWIRQGFNAILSTRVSAGTAVSVPVDPDEPVAGDNVPASSAPEGDAVAPSLPQSQALSSRDLSDFNNFNGRTAIWAATLRGLQENPSILLTGTTPLIAGKTMTVYFPAEAPRENFHNSYVAILVSFGLPGLFLVLALIILLAVRSVPLFLRGLFDARNLHARLLVSVLIFTLAESMMEQFLFVDGMPSVVWVWFLLAAGFTFCFSRKTTAAQSIE